MYINETNMEQKHFSKMNKYLIDLKIYLKKK